MRVFVTGDTHGNAMGELSRFNSKKFKDGKTLTKDDFVIIAGDHGLLWFPESSQYFASQQHDIDWLNSKPWTTLCIDGNHENFDMLNKLPMCDFMGGKARIIANSVLQLNRGEVYTFGNTKILTIGGAASVDKIYRREGESWWKEELLSASDEMNIENNISRHDNMVDYIITHTGPESVMKNDLMPCMAALRGRSSMDYFEDPTGRVLESIYRTVDFKRWYCGHMHIDMDFDDVSFLYHRIVELKLR